MVTVNDSKILEAYRLYCSEVDLEPDSWNSIFDFSAIVGFSVIGGGFQNPHGDSTKLTDRSAKAISWMTGPHSTTLAKVLKNQRYSFYGRVRAPIIKVGHVLAFAGLTMFDVVRRCFK